MDINPVIMGVLVAETGALLFLGVRRMLQRGDKSVDRITKLEIDVGKAEVRSGHHESWIRSISAILKETVRRGNDTAANLQELTAVVKSTKRETHESRNVH